MVFALPVTCAMDAVLFGFLVRVPVEAVAAALTTEAMGLLWMRKLEAMGMGAFQWDLDLLLILIMVAVLLDVDAIASQVFICDFCDVLVVTALALIALAHALVVCRHRVSIALHPEYPDANTRPGVGMGLALGIGFHCLSFATSMSPLAGLPLLFLPLPLSSAATACPRRRLSSRA